MFLVYTALKDKTIKLDFLSCVKERRCAEMILFKYEKEASQAAVLASKANADE